MTTTKGAPLRLAPGMDLLSALALVSPELDDPGLFGEVAAAQVLSQLYATGARPLLAHALVGSPDGLTDKVRKRMLIGGRRALAAAGVASLGETDLETQVLSFGLSVTAAGGAKHRFSLAGGQPGDVLLLTKPLGTGIAAAAIQLGHASRAFTRHAVAQMTTLNRAASEVFQAQGVSAVADVQDLGLLGHLYALSVTSKLRARLELESIPILGGVPALAADGVVPEGSRRNLALTARRVRFPEGLPVDIQLVLSDGQHNGGLLAAVPLKQAAKLVKQLDKAGVDAALVGELLSGKPGVDVVG